ncbi:hypothetical protein RO3G_01878 [Rhizopus delemar RA 99-880]|uniref:GAR domain-containing protein n=1 Tax=Rhizopus delemar (strain RA 99-880 / ATCC MYA-4621 / FGSC 9543 / NRRL 43880) TaxID=246409 RepID=I1BLU4_RHIO9|nr:hypothetical protein RO3G_01878 [Rhizopus delemar RA 99-880]|eukprot:EIE77174.1 hypothetical protein RO3G_01878 [Rhizopus delemar RA 99-880]
MDLTLADTVLAWLQNELYIYFTLSLIQPLPDLNAADDKAIVCLAHRYFSQSVPDLIQQLNQPNRDYFIQLFKERAAVDLETDTVLWLHQFQLWVTSQQENYRQEGYIEFEKNANQLLSQLLELFHQSAGLLKEEQSIASFKREEKEHHLLTLEDIESAFVTIQSQDFADFESNLPEYARTHPTVSAIDATRTVLEHQLHNGDHRHMFQTTAYIRNELQFIQAKMLKTTTTDAGIQDLEERSAKVGELLASLPKQDDDDLWQKHKLICAWVEEVRVWFVEAERIRIWIEERIVILENRATIDALEEVELELSSEVVKHLNKEHEELKEEIETFDKEDMTRLRAHVKALTGNNKDLSPADTTTIEITFSTLMTLDRLMHLLRRRSYELQILTLRMDWEHEYDGAVGWVRSMLEKVKAFMDEKARWRPMMVHLSKEEVIEKLVEFENECSAFDKGQFTTTVNTYQELDDSCHMELPSHLESRQVALEEAFETLTNRIALTRQIVEQYLVVTDFLERADELKTQGEKLRQEITQTEQQQFTYSDLSEKVSLFQEDAIRLVTGLATRIPYPEALHPSDEQANEDANETIRMVIGARKSALILLGEALDQGLNAYRRALQLQKRAKQLQDEIQRLTSWVDERMRAMQKAKVDVFVGKCALDEVDLARLRKERDGQVAKLKGIRENEVKKLNDNIQALSSSSMHQGIYVNPLCSGLSGLEQHLNKLDEALSSHSLGLDILEKRIGWEAFYTKSFQWITNMTSNLWEFTAKKAQWRHRDHTESDWTQTVQEFKDIQSKMDTFEQHSFNSTQQAFLGLVEGFDQIEKEDVPLTNDSNTMTPEHVKRRQETLNRNFTHLKDLCLFTQAVLDQHVSLDAFSAHALTLYEAGEKLMVDLQQHLDNDLYIPSQQEENELEQTTNEYSHQVLDLWTRMGSRIPYPQCNEEARATRPSTADDEISTDIANIVYKSYAELQDLANQIKDLLLRLKTALDHRRELKDCIKETIDLIEHLKQIKQEFEGLYAFKHQLYSDVLQPSDHQLNAKALKDKISQLNCERYEPLMKRTDALLTLNNTNISITQLIPHINQLKATRKGLTEYSELFARQVQCYDTRLHWQSLVESDTSKLSKLQERIRNTTNDKNFWLSLDNQQDELLQKLVKDVTENKKELDDYVSNSFVKLDAAYINMMDAFETLGPKPVMVQDKQIEMKKRMNKMQDAVELQVSEIDLICNRYRWESSTDKILKECGEFEAELDSFIKHHARWSPERSAVDSPRPTFVSYMEQLQRLLDEFEALQQPTEATLKRKSMVESNKCRLESSMILADQVLAQSDAICHCLSNIQALETHAESLKTQFLKSDESEPSDEKDFKAYQVDVQQLDTAIPLPDGDQDQIAYNTTVSDMIQARYARLDELVGILASILKTKEQVSRRRAAESSYLAEVTTVKEWIQSKWVSPDGSQDLREAVQAAAAAHSAVLAYASTITALRASCIKTIEVTEDDTIRTIQSEVDTQYKKLCEHVQLVKQELSKKLRQAEWDQLLNEFHTSYDQLEQEMQIAVEDVTDEVVSDWQERVQCLETSQVEPIRVRAEIDQEKCDEVQAAFADLKALLHRRATETNRYRWKQRYLTDADTLEDLMQVTCDAINVFLKEQGLMQDSLVEVTKAAYESLCSSVETRVDKYDELCSSHRFLQLNKVTEVDKRHQEIEHLWKQTQKKIAQAKQVVDQTAQWMMLFGKLSIKQTLDATVQRLMEESPDFDQERKQLTTLFDAIEDSLLSAQQLSDSIPEGIKVKENMEIFQEQYNKIHKEIIEAKGVLDQKEKYAQKQKDLIKCQTMVSKVKNTVQDQIEQWKQDLENVQQNIANPPIIKQNTMEIKQNKLIQLSTQEIEPLLTRLRDTHGVDTQSMQQDLEDALDQLAEAIKSKTGFCDLIKRSLGHAKSANDISTWIDHCQQAIEQVDPHNEEAQEDLAALDEKMEDFASVMTSFDDMTNEIHQLPKIDEEKDLWDGLASIIYQRAQDINQKWISLKQIRDQVLQDVHRTTHGISMLRKVKNVMNLLGDTRSYLDSIKLPSPTDIKAGQQEDGMSSMLRKPEVEMHLKNLSTVEKEMRTQLEPEISELEKMMAECQEGDALIQQYQETKDAVNRLTDALKTKESELNRALELGQFLTITDDLDILQSSLEEVIGKPAPLMGHGLTRADLQAKTIELDARFKYYENNIMTALKLAKDCSITHQPEKKLVASHLKALESRWELLKKQYKTRKVELSRTIDNKEYQQQQTRIRKSSLPNRKASPLLRAAGDVSRLSPTPSASSSGSTRLTINRHQQPSKSATHVKTPRPRLTKPPLNSYVADPDNDLDIEIGRIVNNAPYRVKVKMVPGEVGRYWFGDVNPKMAYCRVLKSKMVMVRVGGGWTELSQFLRDHALLEGDFIPKLSEAVIHEEEPSIQEGYIETRRAKPMPRSHSPSQLTTSHSASTSGYKQGNKFITVDGYGNQLEVKMRRYSNGEGNDYTKRRMARKKEKLIKEDNNNDNVNTQ